MYIVIYSYYTIFKLIIIFDMLIPVAQFQFSKLAE